MDQREVLRNVILFGPWIQLMLVAARMMVQIPGPIFYLLFLSSLVWPTYLYERDNPGRSHHVIDTTQFSLLSAPAQAITGLAVAGAISAPILLFGHFALGPGTFTEFVFQLLFVAPVETIYMIVLVRTLRFAGSELWALAVFLVLFGLLHIADAVLAGQWGLVTLFRFVYAAAFGLLFWVLYAARKWDVSRAWQDRFGAIASWTAHVTLNMIVILFPLTIGALEFFPLSLGG